MKGLRLFFAACLTPLVFQAVAADNTQTISRTANRRPPQTSSANAVRTRASAPSRGTASVTTRTSSAQTVRQRATNISNRALHTRTATTPAKVVSTRTSTTISPRTIKTTSRSTTTRNATHAINRGRSGTEQPTSPTREEILARDTKKCREVFYGCMDEFCANKDTQLKRCACSTRINEFKGLEQNLTMVEDKLLDFSQHLLTVSMDKEDAAVLNQATAGELAFAQADTSKSKQMLDEIAKKLNTSFNDSNFDQSLNAISLSLNTDTAFDTIDPTAGASTMTKSGTALYSAALPVCREMALEVCSPDELSIAEGGYQMLIEQDCNTVKKSYQAQSDTARAKVFESGALLDMSRLDVHQKRNSDDILTCKTKMLNMLTDSTVCGTDMEKCLDTSGQYIDPTTGDAILSPQLANLANLIRRPQNDTQTWATSNTRYVSFLNGKKKFLEPAMEKCQDIADYVWSQFIEDALSQIKIAQDKKLEQVRQSCTTLTAQCLDKTLDSIAEFDARALSIFGISADKTANAMCADVKMACSALFQQSTGFDSDDGSSTNDWESGMTEITTTKSYETILSTCREVGRNCIIQACTSITGNFGLCEDIDKSINRKSIINRTACWREVYDCVANAGEETIAQIMTQQGRNVTDGNAYYSILYQNSTPEYNNTKNIHDLCTKDCEQESHNCRTCRLTEQIWGNCEFSPGTDITDTNATNRIFTMPMNSENETLLSWFAHNTGTANDNGSCRDTSCPPGYTLQDDTQKCISTEHFTKDGFNCDPTSLGPVYKLPVMDNLKNCCFTGDTAASTSSPINPPKTNFWHSSDDMFFSTYCCQESTRKHELKYHNTLGFLFDDKLNNNNDFNFYNVTNIDNNHGIGAFCSNGSTHFAVAEIKLPLDNGNEQSTETPFALICIGNITFGAVKTDFPSGQEIQCDGTYVLVSEKGLVIDPYTIFSNNSTAQPTVETYYYRDNAAKQKSKCVLQKGETNLAWIATYQDESGKTQSEPCKAATKGWQVKYNN